MIETETKPSALKELLARVEKADGPSEELDALILCATLAPPGAFVERSRFNGAWCIYRAPNKLWERSERAGNWRAEGWPLTASLDAALGLVERVLPHLLCDVTCLHAGLFEACIYNDPTSREFERYGVSGTRALAVCKALLQAKIAESEG